jgi:hypothetical protein
MLFFVFFFGIDNHQRVADIYNHTIQLLEEKAAGLLHGNSIHLWVEHFFNVLVPLKRSWAKKPMEACSLIIFG